MQLTTQLIHSTTTKYHNYLVDLIITLVNKGQIQLTQQMEDHGPNIVVTSGVKIIISETKQR